MHKFDLRTKLTIGPEGGVVEVKRTQPTAWQELGLYLETVAFLAGNAIEEGNSKDIKNHGEMVEYIVSYMNRAMPDYEKK